MPDIVIADTSCFILLSNIGELDLLQKLYGEVSTTPEVAEEFGESLPAWVEIKIVKDFVRKENFELTVDKGEASAIALALENRESTVIIDDLKARRFAASLGVNVTGTVGIMVKAKLSGIIPSIKPLLKKIKETNFRISAAVESKALQEAGE